MAADAVHDAIVAYLSTPANVASLADVVTNVVPPFRFENDNFQMPNPPAPWIAMSLAGVHYGQQSIGAATQATNRWDETGALWLVVLVASGSGASRVRQLTKLIADIFRGLTLINGSLEFMDAVIGEGGPSQETGNWFEIPVIIDWRRIEA